MEIKNVLSLFNGMSCGYLALNKAGFSGFKYYSAEIDKFANQLSSGKFPDIVQLGDVTKYDDWGIDWSSIDLVLAGFPCQAWSLAGKQLGDKDPRGMLFWTTLEIIKKVLDHNPNAKFMMENVKMKREFEEYITKHTEDALGYVEKTLINSALVSAQNRNRYYWTNFKVTQPADKGLVLKDIIEDDVDPKFNLSDEAIAYMSRLRNGKPRWEYHKNPIDGKAACLTANMFKGVPYGVMKVPYDIKGGAIRGRYIVDGKRQDHKQLTAGLTEQRLEVRDDGKSNTLTTVQKDNVVVYKPIDLVNKTATKDGKAYSLTASYSGAVAWNSAERKQRTMVPVCESDIDNPNQYDGVLYRKLTPLECERLQTVPDNFTLLLDENGKQLVSNTQRYKMLGNGWTVDVIAHILEHLK